jgi:hypothetical protein
MGSCGLWRTAALKEQFDQAEQPGARRAGGPVRGGRLRLRLRRGLGSRDRLRTGHRDLGRCVAVLYGRRCCGQVGLRAAHRGGCARLGRLGYDQGRRARTPRWRGRGRGRSGSCGAGRTGRGRRGGNGTRGSYGAWTRRALGPGCAVPGEIPCGEGPRGESTRQHDRQHRRDRPGGQPPGSGTPQGALIFSQVRGQISTHTDQSCTERDCGSVISGYCLGDASGLCSAGTTRAAGSTAAGPDRRRSPTPKSCWWRVRSASSASG